MFQTAHSLVNFKDCTTSLVFAQSNSADDAAAAAGCAGCMGAVVLIPVIIVAVIALHIALWVWIARDSKSRGMDSSVLWMLLVMFTGVLGLGIYLFSRPQGSVVRCSHCKNKRLQASAKCPHCGNT